MPPDPKIDPFARDRLAMTVLPAVISAVANKTGAMPPPAEAVRLTLNYTDALLIALAAD